jgi:translation initiation factor IF-1
MKRALAKSVRASSPVPAANTAISRPAFRLAGRRFANLMAVEKTLELEGLITSVLAGTMFRVRLANDHIVLAHISGKMRKRFIRLTIGDRVKLEMSPYDIDKARIVYRLG